MSSDATNPDPDRQVRFIVGMSRAATTWMGRCFNEHPQTAAFGESAFWGRRYVEPGPEGTYRAGQLRRALRELAAGSMKAYGVGRGAGSLKQVNMENFPRLLDDAFAGAHEPMSPAAVFRRVLDAIAEAEGKAFVIEKTPHHLNWIDRIVAALPEARFVVMVREPYGFMLSYKHMREGRDNRATFERLYHPFGCALVWRRYMQAAEAAGRRYPDRTLLVRFEELRRDPAGVLDRIQRFWGLDPVDLASRVPPDNTSFEGGPRPPLGGEDLFWMNALNRGLIRRCGFELRPAGFAPLRVAWSLLLLPYWAVRNLANLHRRTAGPVWSYLWRWLRPRRA